MSETKNQPKRMNPGTVSQPSGQLQVDARETLLRATSMALCIGLYCNSNIIFVLPRRSSNCNVTILSATS